MDLGEVEKFCPDFGTNNQFGSLSLLEPGRRFHWKREGQKSPGGKSSWARGPKSTEINDNFQACSPVSQKLLFLQRWERSIPPWPDSHRQAQRFSTYPSSPRQPGELGTSDSSPGARHCLKGVIHPVFSTKSKSTKLFL